MDDNLDVKRASRFFCCGALRRAALWFQAPGLAYVGYIGRNEEALLLRRSPVRLSTDVGVEITIRLFRPRGAMQMLVWSSYGVPRLRALRLALQ